MYEILFILHIVIICTTEASQRNYNNNDIIPDDGDYLLYAISIACRQYNNNHNDGDMFIKSAIIIMIIADVSIMQCGSYSQLTDIISHFINLSKPNNDISVMRNEERQWEKKIYFISIYTMHIFTHSRDTGTRTHTHTTHKPQIWINLLSIDMLIHFFVLLRLFSSSHVSAIGNNILINHLSAKAVLVSISDSSKKQQTNTFIEFFFCQKSKFWFYTIFFFQKTLKNIFIYFFLE